MGNMWPSSINQAVLSLHMCIKELSAVGRGHEGMKPSKLPTRVMLEANRGLDEVGHEVVVSNDSQSAQGDLLLYPNNMHDIWNT